MKTSELQGAALDWAVAKCEGREQAVSKNNGGSLSFDAGLHPYMADLDKAGRYQIYTPSTDWAQGGPIIERELIDIVALTDSDEWLATMLSPDYADHQCAMFGTTLLIAAMRCFVVSKLGDEIELPEELK
jgi:hypothetical protein